MITNYDPKSNLKQILEIQLKYCLVNVMFFCAVSHKLFVVVIFFSSFFSIVFLNSALLLIWTFLFPFSSFLHQITLNSVHNYFVCMCSFDCIFFSALISKHLTQNLNDVIFVIFSHYDNWKTFIMPNLEKVYVFFFSNRTHGSIRLSCKHIFFVFSPSFFSPSNNEIIDDISQVLNS